MILEIYASISSKPLLDFRMETHSVRLVCKIASERPLLMSLVSALPLAEPA
jgi:hypothetical protein